MNSSRLWVSLYLYSGSDHVHGVSEGGGCSCSHRSCHGLQEEVWTVCWSQSGELLWRERERTLLLLYMYNETLEEVSSWYIQIVVYHVQICTHILYTKDCNIIYNTHNTLYNTQYTVHNMLYNSTQRTHNIRQQMCIYVDILCEK